LKSAIDLLESLYAFTDDLRNRSDEFEGNALTASDNSDYLSVLARPRKRTRHFDEMKGTDVVLQGREKFRIETFIVIVNQLQTSPRGRIDAYKDVRKVFIVIAEFHVLDNDQLREHAQTLAETYSTDLEPSMFCNEMVQFVHFAKSRGCKTPASLAVLLHKEDLHSAFPNVAIALRIYMCLMVSNCSGERSFSKMALIENKLRSTMTDRRLTALELLSVESDVLDTVSFMDIVDQFATDKSRKRF